MLIAQSEDVLLREFEERDVLDKIRWINDPANHKYLHYDIPLEYEKTLNWFRNKNNASRTDCVIEYRGTPVGVIGLLAIDRTSRKAEYYITVGETTFQRKGIAATASRLILKYGFQTLGLNKVYLNVDADNKPAIRLYEKLGFRQEGYFREDLMRRGVLIDRVRYSFFANDFCEEDT